MSDTGQEPGVASPKPQTIREISLYLMSERGGADLTVQYEPAGVTAVEELLSLFGAAEGATFSIDPVQVASPSLKTALGALVTRHASTTPHLHRLKKFVSDLPSDTHFLLLPARPQSTGDRLECERYLHRLNHPDDTADDDGAVDLFQLLLERYDMDCPRTDRRTLIGAAIKGERRCRFCHRSIAEGATFESVAHAIPTALGNDHLKLADECDDCNGYFGRETEPSLIAMLDIPRAFLGIQGRSKNGGRPELRFEDGRLQNDGQMMNVESRSFVHDEPTGRMTVDLGKGAPIIPAAVYRALVKIALSVVDAEALPFLKETIAWVRHGAHRDRSLPRVATAIVNLPPNPSAQIVVYRRKGPHARLPHLIGEFRLGCYLYVFAVPFSDEDSWDLVGFFEDEDFRDTFKHYAAVERWTQNNLSSPDKIILAPKLLFVPREPPKGSD
jgi:HNH endonuclease